MHQHGPLLARRRHGRKKGDQGIQGIQGRQGNPGTNGTNGIDGANRTNGADMKWITGSSQDKVDN